MRQSIDEYYMKMAALIGERGTCVRNKIGCVVTNTRNEVLATGFNGNPRGFYHCIDTSCKVPINEVAYLSASCLGVHAEQNALLKCKNVDQIESCYVTKFPCMTCLKMLLNTSCTRIIYGEDSKNIKDGIKLWGVRGIAFKLIPGGTYSEL